MGSCKRAWGVWGTVGRQLGWVEGDIRLRRDLEAVSNGELLQVLEGRRNSLGLETDALEEREEWLTVACMGFEAGRPGRDHGSRHRATMWEGKGQGGWGGTPEALPSGPDEC